MSDLVLRPGAVAVMPLADSLPSFPNRHSGWWVVANDVVRQHWWDQLLPTAAKKAYRAAATRGLVDVDFGAGAVTMGAATGQLDLTGESTLHVPATDHVRWAALDQLPRCTTLTWSGADRGLSAALMARPIVSTLIWRNTPPTVDLTGTGLHHVRLSGPMLDWFDEWRDF